MQSIMIRLLFIFTILFGLPQVIICQVNDQLIREELQSRGIDEDVFLEKLRSRGISYNSLDEVPQSEIPRIQQIVQEILLEIERESTDSIKPAPISSPSTPISTQNQKLEEAKEELQEIGQEIEESIDAGASVQEALTEELIEQQIDLPKSTIYGHEIFRNSTLKLFRQSENIKPKDTYILGPGDEVTISIWGISVFENTFIIDQYGYIKPESMPRILLKGLPFNRAKAKLQSTFSQFYRFNSSEFDVQLRFARTISIGIFGEVFQPGNFTISAINSAFNAMVASGGPSDIGTIRNIKWIRSDGDVQILDVYRYMLEPQIAESYYLQENDILQVPIAERIVSIGGAVKRPMRYELIEGEHLLKLIDYAGGLIPNAYTEIIQLKRFENDQQIVVDIPLKQLIDTNQDFPLLNGDVLMIRTIPTAYKNFVEINGAVEFPGEYEFLPGMRIADLIDKARFKEETARNIAFMRRTNYDGTFDFIRIDLASILADRNSVANIELASGDRVLINAKSAFTDNYTVQIGGAVRNPGEFAYDPSQTMRVRDLILMAGGLRPDATSVARIRRLNFDGSSEFIPVDVFTAFQDAASGDNIILAPGDHLSVDSQTKFTDTYSVSINGQVRNPGTFPYDVSQTMTVHDIIVMAGGLATDATDFGYLIRRNLATNEPEYIQLNVSDIVSNAQSGSNLVLAPRDEIIIQSKQTFLDKATLTIGGAVRNPGTYEYDASMTIKKLITLSNGLTISAASNRIDVSRMIITNNEPTQTVVATLSLNDSLRPIGNPGFALQPYDQVFVRTVPEFEFQKTVTVSGEVTYPGPYSLLVDNERITSLIERAGGITGEAFPAGATLVRASDDVGPVIIQLDEVLRNNNSKSNIILRDGDRIFVPKVKDLVTIRGAINSTEILNQELVGPNNAINVVYDGSKGASYYIREFAGGIADHGNRKKITVEYPNGEIKQTRNFFFFRTNPKVDRGSIVTVGTKAEKVDRPEGEQEKVNWGEVFANSIAQTTAVLTLILLLDRASR
jgi:protein involved in polysaccharide export with SLBB domain